MYLAFLIFSDDNLHTKKKKGRKKNPGKNIIDFFRRGREQKSFDNSGYNGTLFGQDLGKVCQADQLPDPIMVSI